MYRDMPPGKIIILINKKVGMSEFKKVYCIGLKPKCGLYEDLFVITGYRALVLMQLSILMVFYEVTRRQSFVS